MFLQILPPNSPDLSETALAYETLLVVIGLGLGVFGILKLAKFIQHVIIAKKTNNPSYL